MRWRRAVVTVALVGAGLISGCGPRRAQAPHRATQDQIVLLPDPDGGPSGRAIVSGSKPPAATLASARDSTVVSGNQPPSAVTPLDDAETKRLFGGVLSTLPPAPQHFTLYFRFETDDLTRESQNMVGQVLRIVHDRPIPDVVVIGHTDTIGPPKINYALGLRRATMVRRLLIRAGIDAAAIEAVSHGEADLQVPTANETLEPRNRRVEITVR